MFKNTNIDSLGTEYTVTDTSGNVIKKIQVVTHSEILDAALGKFTPEFGSIKNYLEKSVATLSGTDTIDPYKVLWYSTPDEQVVLSEIIEYAVQNGYDKIVLEHLEELGQGLLH
jgi:hypothetical protein